MFKNRNQYFLFYPITHLVFNVI